VVTAVRRLGEAPTTAEIVTVLQRQVVELQQAVTAQAAQIAAQAATISTLVARTEAEDQVDGPAPAPLPASWVPFKRAAEISGYSASALRKLKSPRWWKYDAGRVWVHTATCPRKV
jgi:hypothetical protein